MITTHTKACIQEFSAESEAVPPNFSKDLLHNEVIKVPDVYKMLKHHGIE